MRISSPAVSYFFSSSFTIFIILASWALFSSSQKIAVAPVAFALFIASFTQSLIASSFAIIARQISPFSTLKLRLSLPSLSTNSPSSSAIKVLSWLPYSSAFFAIRPTFDTEPTTAGFSAPFSFSSSMIALYIIAYVLSGIAAKVSCSLPSLFHILPLFLIIFGIELSMMISLGTCRFVIPLSLSTIARAGRVARISLYFAITLSFIGLFSILANRSFSPLLAFTPRFFSCSPNSLNSSAKNTLTKCPNITGSLTFIIVAFR